MIQTIEEHTLNAWPALQQLLYDGWVLRFANGYTGRANSVNVLQASQQDVAEKIQYCINLYHQQKQPAIFRITPLAQAEELDTILAHLDFYKRSPTSVQTLDLASFSGEPPLNFHYWSRHSSEWEAHFARLSGKSVQHQTHQQILQNIIPQTCFALLRHEETVVACGLAVLAGCYVGLFDIIIDQELRRQGYGQQLVENMLCWAKSQGASRAYLQVEQKNAGATALYAKLGFTELYPYWYRVLDVL